MGAEGDEGFVGDLGEGDGVGVSRGGDQEIAGGGVEVYGGWGGDDAHVDGHGSVSGAVGDDDAGSEAGVGGDRDRGGLAVGRGRHPAQGVEGGAADAVAAHLGARSIGVEENHPGGGGGRGWGEQQQPVAADSASSVAEGADGIDWGERDVGPLAEDEVVGRSFVLVEGSRRFVSAAWCGHGVAAQSWRRIGKQGTIIVVADNRVPGWGRAWLPG